MPRGKLTPEGRERLREAQRLRWARYRAQKGNGGGGATGLSRVGRRGRRGRMAARAVGGNPYLNMTVSELLSAKQQLDEAWSMAARLLRRG